MPDDSTLVIGGNFFGHDSAIFALIPGKKSVFAIQTERLTRYKHDQLFPVAPIAKMISYEGIDARSIRKVVFCQMSQGPQKSHPASNEIRKELALRAHLGAVYKKDMDQRRYAFAKLSGVVKALDCLKTSHGRYLLYDALATRIGLIRPISSAKLIHDFLNTQFPNAQIDIRFYDHEYCHVVCAAVTAPFDEALLFSIDGWGDDYFSRVFSLKRRKIELVANSRMRAPIAVGEKHISYSIGAIYEYFTLMLGFTPSSDEGKVEALAAYGQPLPALEAMVDCVTFEDLAINIDPKIGTIMEKMPWQYRENCSATVQKFLEIITEKYLRLLTAHTGIKNIALAGGVAANVINNLNIMEKVADHIHITPAMADDGAAQGAAYAYLLESGVALSQLRALTVEMPYFGTSYSRDEVRPQLDNFGQKITVQDLGVNWPERVGELVHEGKIGAIFHGKMEWGPRALGNRSIIADPRRKDFRDKINKEIKRRPVFQPFCPSMLLEEKDRLFEQAYINKHMTCAFRMKKEYWEQLPSAIHIDGTARVQFVEEKDNPNYYRLLKRVKELTGYGVVINTSFNKHGRTIVETPEDAIRDFLDTDMDYLVIEGFLVTRV